MKLKYFFCLAWIVSYSQTNISGIFDENTTWTVSESPYNITSDVTFNSNLTIESGVTVNLNGGYLRVRGKLIANGTELKEIKFIGQHGVWLDNTTTLFDDNKDYIEGNSFNYCRFEITRNGLALEVGEFAIFLDHSSALINNSKFTGGVGIVFDYIYNDNNRNTGSVISNSQFDLNGNNAISIASFSCGLDISNNLIENNTFDDSPVRLGQYCVNSFNNTIKHNFFKNCNTALYLGWGDVVSGVLGAYIYNNVFIDNGTGVIIGSRPGSETGPGGIVYDASRIRQNLFINNSSHAIKADGTYHNESLIIFKNIIINSGDGDLILDDEAGVRITNNLIYNTTLPLVGDNQSLISFDEGYQQDETKNNKVLGNTFISSFRDIITSYYGGNEIKGNNIFGSNFNYIIKATGNGNETIFANNSVDSSVLSSLDEKILDSSDSPDLYNVLVSGTSNNWKNIPPILPPQKTVKVISGNDLELTWEANPESDIAGYRLYYGNPSGYSYENVIDLGNVTSYTFEGGANYENVALTAYDTDFPNVDTEDLVHNSKQVLGNESWYSVFQTYPKVAVSTTKTDIAEGAFTKIKFDLDQASSEDLSIKIDFSGDSSLGYDYNLEYQDVLFEENFNSLDESSSLSPYYFIIPVFGDTPKLEPTLSDSNGNKFLTYEASGNNFKNTFATQWTYKQFSSATNSGDKIKLSFRHKWEGDVNSYRLEGNNGFIKSSIQLKSPIENEWTNFEMVFDGDAQDSANFVIYVFNNVDGSNQLSKLHIDDVKIECVSCIRNSDNQIIGISKGELSKQFKINVKSDFEDEQTETLILDFTLNGSAELSTETLSLNILNSKTSITKLENPFPGLSQGDVSWGDFDNDGDKDVALMGVSNVSGAVTAIYENKGSEGFVNTNQNFEKVIDGTLAWVDLNKDGYIDLVVSGYNGNSPSTKVYLNRDALYFEEDDTYNIPDLYATKLAFGDLDNDGDIDYLIVGYDSSDQVKRYYGFKRNTGDGYDLVTPNISPYIGDHFLIFDKDSDGDNDIVSSNTSVINSLYNESQGSAINYYSLQNGGNIIAFNGASPGAGPEQITKNGYISVGDFDNNGYNDFILTGEDSNGSGITKLYLGSSNGVIETSDYDLEGLRDSTAEFIDYDKDGDLDIFLTGVSDTGGNQTLLYEVDVTNKSNEAPYKITSTSFENLGGGNVKLSWEAPEDDFSSELGYNVRIGTTPGGSELSNTESNLETGDRLINKAPPTFNNFYIRQLDPGTYYWAVQAIDGGYKGGDFSEEQSFTLTYDWKVLNQGGIIDNNISGKTNPVLKFTDLDNDGDLDLLYGGDNLSSYLFDGKKYISSGGYNGNDLGSFNNLKDLAIGDLNNDLVNDIVISYGDGKVHTLVSGYNFAGAGLTNDQNLYDAKAIISDTNNDGVKEIVVVGKSSNTSSAKLKLYVFEPGEPGENNSPIGEKKDYSYQITSLLNSSYDLGDFDNDQDVDLILSGFSAFDGIKTILYENITEPGGELTLVATDNNLVSVRDGSNDFIDFDSDGDLDVVISGTSFNSDIFEVYLNNGSTTWPRVDVNLDGIRNTKVDLGDFNGDGYSDLLYTGTETGSGKITKLSEFDPNNLTYIDSDFDVSDIKDAAVEFGDLDGDGDLDFVIAGSSESTSQNIFRTYINYRNDSYDVLNPPSERKYDVLVNHDGLETTMKNSSTVEVAAIQLKYENDVDINFAESLINLSKINNGDPLTIVQNKNQVLVYGDVTKRFSSVTSFEPILVHNSADNTIKEIVSVAGFVGDRLKSITSKSKIYEDGLTVNSFFSRKIKAMSLTSAENQNEQIFINQRPDMPFILSEEVINQSNSLGKTEVLLGWNQAFDDNTPSEGLTYSIKVGTSPGAEDIVSSNSNVNGLLKSSQKGNAEHNTSWKLALEPGLYYWSVQSIDNSFNGSLFSPEKTFEIKSDGTLSKDDSIEDIKTSIYPNPVKSDFTISSVDSPIDNVSIYNVNGQLVGYKLSSRSRYNVTINIGELSKGIYVLVVDSGESKIAKKLIKD